MPDLSSYRRAQPLTLDEVNRLARRNWTSWDEVDPPRKFPGSLYRPMQPGDVNIWDDHWYEEWQVFRQHVVGLHYDELSKWVHEAGIPKDRIFSAQGFISPDPGNKPIAIKITSRGKNIDTSGVSLEGLDPALRPPGRGDLRRHGGEQDADGGPAQPLRDSSRAWTRSGAWSSSTTPT